MQQFPDCIDADEIDRAEMSATQIRAAAGNDRCASGTNEQPDLRAVEIRQADAEAVAADDRAESRRRRSLGS